MKQCFPLITLLLFFLTLLTTTTVQAEDRAIKRIKDMTHDSGKLGSYKALLIAIDDYRDPKYRI